MTKLKVTQGIAFTRSFTLFANREQTVPLNLTGFVVRFTIRTVPGRLGKTVLALSSATSPGLPWQGRRTAPESGWCARLSRVSWDFRRRPDGF